MSDRLLLVAPRFDTATEYSFEWATAFHDMIKDDPDIEYTTLLEALANKNEFDAKMPYHDVLVFFDHGVKDALIGQNLAKLVKTVSVGKLTGKKVFTMACLSASELGVHAFHNGCLEYWGATESIGFTLVDADLFGEIFVRGAYQRFVEGLSIDEVLTNMDTHFVEQMDKTQNPWTKMWLQKDRDMWICWHEGNKPKEPKSLSIWRIIFELLLEIFGMDFAKEEDIIFNLT